jgi:hypothetical protein
VGVLRFPSRCCVQRNARSAASSHSSCSTFQPERGELTKIMKRRLIKLLSMDLYNCQEAATSESFGWTSCVEYGWPAIKERKKLP